MSKIIFVSNRLPVTVAKNDGGIEYQKSIGGLATGLKSYHDQVDSLWIGWSGISEEEVNEKEREVIKKELLKNYKCIPVVLDNMLIEQYYDGFCNKTIWPLFHYFTNKTEYDYYTWEAYKKVNCMFFEALESVIEEDDVVWVHDYQLMLLPNMIKEKYPNVKVGFFLHIPFPSYEIFRLLVWREEVVLGMLGADLIGFHTYDYVRHFISTVRRLLGLESTLNKITFEDRYVQVDAFPMGIDYERFSHLADTDEKEVQEIRESAKGMRMLLSIDRLDYTKGIPERIKAFGIFLENYPEYQGKVRLNLIVAPSRVEVDTYGELRRVITELVSEINGKYGTMGWMPIWFFFQSFPQETLISFYRYCDVLLVTPLRDGMNLVAKEYFASRIDYEGMVVLSETAGAASELGEAVVVNANDLMEIAKGIKRALEMPRDEKIAINRLIHKRLKRYNVDFWAKVFIDALVSTNVEETSTVKPKIDKNCNTILCAYREAEKRILLLDYDGTLVGFKSIPEQAKPDGELKSMLRQLAADPKNTVVIVSGRDRHTLEKWLGDIDLHMLASHGLWLRHPDEEWKMTVPLDNSWKETVHHLLEMYTDRMPGSLIEEKEYSLAFHYRQCEPDMVSAKLGEVREALMGMTHSMSIGVQEGKKVLEIKDNRVNKGNGAALFLQDHNFDFILGVGDDRTDEDMFWMLPEDAFSIKIGIGNTRANHHLKSWQSLRVLLQILIKESGELN